MPAATRRRNVLLLSPERIRSTMAGIGIRFFEMSRSLAKSFDVVLGIPNDPAEAPAGEGFRIEGYGDGRLPELCRDRQAVVLHGHVSDLYFRSGISLPLAIDLYDPFAVENLNYFPVLGDEPYRRDRATLERQLRRGDLFLCSSPEQRLFYLGMLFALGRLNPQIYFDDFQLENLIRIVPFGVPSEAPARAAPTLRGVVPGIGPGDPVVFFGGIYDWYDPLLLLDAAEELVPEFPDLRLVFSANPNPESTPQGTYARVLETCRGRGWIGRHAFFVPWVPYRERGGLFLEATVGVALHRRRFETEVSLRTRVLEFLWAGLPVVVTEGGPMSRAAAAERLGLVVPEGDRAALVAALRRLLSDPRLRQETAGRARRWAGARTWDRVLEPLAAFLAEPRCDPHKDRYPPSRGTAPGGVLGRLTRKLRGGS